MNNLRFATAIHILVLLDKFSNQLITSQFIASSINVNPVVVRRELKFLKKAGYINSKQGKTGGCFLSKNPKNILLGDVYKLVNGESFFGKMNLTNAKCSVGKMMNENLKILFDDAEYNLIRELNKKTLKEFSDLFVT